MPDAMATTSTDMSFVINELLYFPLNHVAILPGSILNLIVTIPTKMKITNSKNVLYSHMQQGGTHKAERRSDDICRMFDGIDPDINILSFVALDVCRLQHIDLNPSRHFYFILRNHLV